MTSIFATRLKLIMDEGGLFNRQEWSQFCKCSEQTIKDWLSDEAFPKPEMLRMIVRVVSESDGMESLHAHFMDMCKMRTGTVTPFANILEKFAGEDCRTLDEYLTIPIFKGFLHCLRGRTSEQMREVLSKASEHVRSFRQGHESINANEADEFL